MLRLIPMTFARIVAGDWLRSAFGALLGIAITGAISAWWVGGSPLLPVLMAPIGASAVLLFAVPASPLAQPWAILGGNVISALIGVFAAHLVPAPLFAAAIAVGGAIAAMSLMRCLHPPGGAVALTAALTGQHVPDLSFDFALVPVLLDSALLAAVAMFYNRATGRSYPHRAHEAQHPHPPKSGTVLTDEDFEAVLADYGETLDISRQDLKRLYLELTGQEAERRALLRKTASRSPPV